MRKITALILTLLSLAANGADTVSEPSHQGGIPMVRLASGRHVPLSVVMSTDGSGGLSPLLTAGEPLTVNQGDAGLDPWVFDLPEGASTSVLQTAANSSLSSIDGKITTCNTGAVVVSSSSLPSGASTESNQTTANASLLSIDNKLPASLTVSGSRLLTDGSGVTQPVSAASLPLPSGASTSANQTTANASLSSIDSKLSLASASQLSGFSSTAALLFSGPGHWTSVHVPSANTVATTTKAAGGSSVRHIATGISVSLINTNVLAGNDYLVQLRDGASGAGTVLWASRLTVAAGAAVQSLIHITGLNIVGSANTAMTLEFSAGPGSGNFETVSLSGYDTQ